MSDHLVISCAQARTLLAVGPVTVLDMRDYRSYRANRIEGALMLHDGLQQTIVNERDLHKPILIYCYRGNTSKEKAQYFFELGFEQVYSLEGGFTEWSKPATPCGPSQSAELEPKPERAAQPTKSFEKL